jgi:hypothetical protein
MTPGLTLPHGQPGVAQLVEAFADPPIPGRPDHPHLPNRRLKAVAAIERNPKCGLLRGVNAKMMAIVSAAVLPSRRSCT